MSIFVEDKRAAMKAMFVKVLRFLIVALAFLLAGIGCVVYERTLAPVWIPLGIGLTAAIITFPLYRRWRWLTTVERKGMNALCHLVCVGILGSSLFLLENCRFAHPASTEEVKVTVLEKLIKKREKRRRIGRNRYVRDGVREEYYLKVAFDNGTIKTLHVSIATYNKARKDKPKTLTLQQGCFGLPVITKGM